jgi:hypothetical protein
MYTMYRTVCTRNEKLKKKVSIFSPILDCPGRKTVLKSLTIFLFTKVIAVKYTVVRKSTENLQIK